MAEKLAVPLKSFGYDVWDTSRVLVGDNIVKELSDRLAENGPVVIVGTIRAAGSKWLKAILGELQGYHYSKRVYPVRMELDANLEGVCLGAKIAECTPSFSEGIRQLREALGRNFPDRFSGRGEATLDEAPKNFDDWLTNWSSFSEDLVDVYRKRLRPEIRESKLRDELDSLTFLEKANLSTGGRLYASGVLLFTDYPEQLIPSAFIQCVRYHGSSRDSGQDQRDLYGSIATQIEGAMLFATTRIEKIEITTPSESTANFIYQFPMACLREIIANSVCHRDYTMRDRHVHVRIFNDRIEISSPGEWGVRDRMHIEECSLEVLESESITRNERLASALRWSGFVETQGSGIPNALADCKETKAPYPVVVNRDGFVRVTIFPRSDWGAEVISRRGRLAADRIVLNIGRLPVAGSLFIGRETELARLDAAWENSEIYVLTLVAFGGTGKSALVSHWLDRMSIDGWRGARRVLDWSFYSQGTEERVTSAERFLDHALAWFGDPDPKAGAPRDRGLRLAELVRQEKSLIILDGVEPLQHPPSHPLAGRLKDPGLASFLKGLAGANSGLCVVTTRERIADLESSPRTAPQEDLEALSPEAGAELLKQLGVKGKASELLSTSREFGNHALTLTLLGGYLSRACGGDIRRRKEVDLAGAAERKGGHALRVIGTYAEWLGEGPELAVLRLLGLFDRPAGSKSLAALRAKPSIPGLTEPLMELGEGDWQLALMNLREHGLLLPADPHQPGTLDAHPLVRVFFQEELERQRPEAWRAGNLRLYEHFQKEAPDLPDTLEDMGALFIAVVYGCRAGRQKEAFNEVYWRRILRGSEFYSTRRLGAFGSELSALSAFFDRPWDQPSASFSPADQAFLLNAAGFRLRALGRLAEAVQPMEAATSAASSQENWSSAAAGANNLSELTLTLGEVERAVAFGKQSVDLADRSGDAFQRMGSRTTLADALHQAGRWEESAEAFREAEALQAERQPPYPRLYSVQGYQYCDLLLSRGEPKDGAVLNGLAADLEVAQRFRATCLEVRERAEQTIKVAERNLGLLDIALDHLSLGRAHHGLALTAHRPATPGEEAEASFAKAAEHLDHAVEGLRRAGDEEFVSRGLLTRAALRRLRGDLPAAEADLSEALEIAERGSMRLHECDAHLEWARFCHQRGDHDGLERHVARARSLVKETGYERRRRELEWLVR